MVIIDEESFITIYTALCAEIKTKFGFSKKLCVTMQKNIYNSLISHLNDLSWHSSSDLVYRHTV